MRMRRGECGEEDKERMRRGEWGYEDEERMRSRGEE